MDYIANYTTFSEYTNENEVNRYISWPGQVSNPIIVKYILMYVCRFVCLLDIQAKQLTIINLWYALNNIGKYTFRHVRIKLVRLRLKN